MYIHALYILVDEIKRVTWKMMHAFMAAGSVEGQIPEILQAWARYIYAWLQKKKGIYGARE